MALQIESSIIDRAKNIALIKAIYIGKSIIEQPLFAS